MKTDQEYYSPDEVAELLNLHVRTVRRYIREGRLAASRIGKQYRIAAADLQALIGRDGRPLEPRRRRRALVSSTVDIDAISPADVQRISAALSGAFAAGNQRSHSKRLDCIYYEEEGRLRVVINAELDYANAILGLINVLYTSLQSES